MLTLALLGVIAGTATALDAPCGNTGVDRCGIALDQPSSLDEGVALALNTNNWQECEMYCNAQKYCTFWLFDLSGVIWNTCRLYKQDFRHYLSKCNTVFGDIRKGTDDSRCRDDNTDLENNSCAVIRYGGCYADVEVSETGEFSSTMTESTCATWSKIGDQHAMYQMDREEAKCYLYNEFKLRCSHIYGPSKRSMAECDYEASKEASDIELAPLDARFDAKPERRTGAVCSDYFRNQCSLGDPEESSSSLNSEACAQFCDNLHSDKDEDNGCDYWVFKSYAPQGHNCLTYKGDVDAFLASCGALGGVQDRANMDGKTYVSPTQDECLTGNGRKEGDKCYAFVESECFIDDVVLETIPTSTGSSNTLCAAACNVNKECEAFFLDLKNKVCRLYKSNPRSCNMHFGRAEQSAKDCGLSVSYGKVPQRESTADMCGEDNNDDIAYFPGRLKGGEVLKKFRKVEDKEDCYTLCIVINDATHWEYRRGMCSCMKGASMQKKNVNYIGSFEN